MQSGTSEETNLAAEVKAAAPDFLTLQEGFGGLTGLAEDFVGNLNKGIGFIDASMHDVINQMGQGLSFAEGIRKEVAEAAISVTRLGGDQTKALAVMTDTLSTFGRNILLTGEQVEELYAVNQVTGVSVKTLEEGFLNAGMSLTHISEEMLTVRETANSLGVNAKAVSATVVGNLDKLNKYTFQGGVEGLAKMAAKAQALRYDMGETFGLADDLMSPERAIEMASAIQRLGGASSALADPLKLMDLAQNDVGELQNQLGQMFKTYTAFDEKTGKFEIMPGARRQLKEIAGELGIDVKEVEKLALGTADLDKKMSEISFTGINIDDETKEMVANMSTMGKGGEYVIKVKDEATGELIERNTKDLMEEYAGRESELTKLLQDQQAAEGETPEEKMINLAKSQLDVLTDIRAGAAAVKIAPGMTAGASEAGVQVLRLNQEVANTINEPLLKNLGPGSVFDTKLESFGGELKKVVDKLVDLKNAPEDQRKAQVEEIFREAKDAASGMFTDIKGIAGEMLIELGGLAGISKEDLEEYKKTLIEGAKKLTEGTPKKGGEAPEDKGGEAPEEQVPAGTLPEEKTSPKKGGEAPTSELMKVNLLEVQQANLPIESKTGDKVSEEIKNLSQNFEKSNENLGDSLKEANKAIAEASKSEAQKTTPVETGETQIPAEQISESLVDANQALAEFMQAKPEEGSTAEVVEGINLATTEPEGINAEQAKPTETVTEAKPFGMEVGQAMASDEGIVTEGFEKLAQSIEESKEIVETPTPVAETEEGIKVPEEKVETTKAVAEIITTPTAETEEGIKVPEEKPTEESKGVQIQETETFEPVKEKLEETPEETKETEKPKEEKGGFFAGLKDTLSGVMNVGNVVENAKGLSEMNPETIATIIESAGEKIAPDLIKISEMEDKGEQTKALQELVDKTLTAGNALEVLGTENKFKGKLGEEAGINEGVTAGLKNIEGVNAENIGGITELLNNNMTTIIDSVSGKVKEVAGEDTMLGKIGSKFGFDPKLIDEFANAAKDMAEATDLDAEQLKGAFEGKTIDVMGAMAGEIAPEEYIGEEIQPLVAEEEIQPLPTEEEIGIAEGVEKAGGEAPVETEEKGVATAMAEMSGEIFSNVDLIKVAKLEVEESNLTAVLKEPLDNLTKLSETETTEKQPTEEGIKVPEEKTTTTEAITEVTATPTVTEEEGIKVPEEKVATTEAVTQITPTLSATTATTAEEGIKVPEEKVATTEAVTQITPTLSATTATAAEEEGIKVPEEKVETTEGKEEVIADSLQEIEKTIAPPEIGPPKGEETLAATIAEKTPEFGLEKTEEKEVKEEKGGFLSGLKNTFSGIMNAGNVVKNAQGLAEMNPETIATIIESAGEKIAPDLIKISEMEDKGEQSKALQELMDKTLTAGNALDVLGTKNKFEGKLGEGAGINEGVTAGLKNIEGINAENIGGITEMLNNNMSGIIDTVSGKVKEVAGEDTMLGKIGSKFGFDPKLIDDYTNMAKDMSEATDLDSEQIAGVFEGKTLDVFGAMQGNVEGGYDENTQEGINIETPQEEQIAEGIGETEEEGITPEEIVNQEIMGVEQIPINTGGIESPVGEYMGGEPAGGSGEASLTVEPITIIHKVELSGLPSSMNPRELEGVMVKIFQESQGMAQVTKQMVENAGLKLLS